MLIQKNIYQNIGSFAAIIAGLKFLNKNIRSFATIIIRLKFLGRNISGFAAIASGLKFLNEEIMMHHPYHLGNLRHLSFKFIKKSLK
ncbi:MAG: hypothetical protein HQK67_01230 [Desulfamplus sp.]|nr:hypothetical protein [Desulfamplus sp.]